MKKINKLCILGAITSVLFAGCNKQEKYLNLTKLERNLYVTEVSDYEYGYFTIFGETTDLTENELENLTKLFEPNKNVNYSELDYEIDKNKLDEYLKSIGFKLSKRDEYDGDHLCYYTEFWYRKLNYSDK